MKTYRLNSVMAGILYILGTVGGVLSLVIAGDLVTGDDILARIAADPSRLILGAFFILVMGFSLAAMTTFLYPLFRKDSEPLALGMVVFRGALEGAVYIMSVLLWLLLLGLAKEYAGAGADTASLQAVGNVVAQVTDTIAPVHTFVFIIGATCLYTSFYRTRLIPRWLSGWGLIAAVFFVAVDLLKFFDISHSLDILYLPMAVQEMVMALWLIVKGFNPTAIAAIESETAS
jgi:hypothetical protein